MPRPTGDYTPSYFAALTRATRRATPTKLCILMGRRRSLMLFSFAYLNVGTPYVCSPRCISWGWHASVDGEGELLGHLLAAVVCHPDGKGSGLNVCGRARNDGGIHTIRVCHSQPVG
jgi:hypothetical protein